MCVSPQSTESDPPNLFSQFSFDLQSLDGHHSRVECVRFTNSDDYVYSADENGIIKKWDLNNCDSNSTFYGHMKTVRSLDFHPYGDYLVSGSHDTSVRLVSLINLSINIH